MSLSRKRALMEMGLVQVAFHALISDPFQHSKHPILLGGLPLKESGEGTLKEGA